MCDPCRLPIVILAAGRSARMRGRDKLLEPIEGIPLLLRQVRAALSATSGDVIVTLPPLPHPRHDLLGDVGVRIIDVPHPDSGMSASLRAGIDALPPSAPAAMILLADMPELQPEDLRKVCAAFDPTGTSVIWRGATHAGEAGHPVIFDRCLFAELRALTGDSGGAEIVRRHADRVTLVALPDARATRDLDTPEDWAAWRSGQ